MSLDVDVALARRLYEQAGAGQWDVSLDAFRDALSGSATRAFGPRQPVTADLERYLRSLHLADLALACACSAGHDAAWEHVMREYRPVLYRSADALDPAGGARELADAIWADLYGLSGRDGRRRSLFRYFHGRSSLATWLRSVLAQRHVDRFRAARREAPLPDEDTPATLANPGGAADADWRREPHAAALARALRQAIAGRAPRERLRLGCYYARNLTLARIGRITGEHEATVSRQLAKTRRAIRADVERMLRNESGLTDAQIRECIDAVASDAGAIDLGDVLETRAGRKNDARDRSTLERLPNDSRPGRTDVPPYDGTEKEPSS